MRILLEKVGTEPHQWQEIIEIPAAELERTELLELGAIFWSGQVWMDSPGYRLEAVLSYEQTVVCDRCLTPIVQAMESDVALLVLPNAPEPTEEEIELSTDDLEILYLEGDEIDTRRILIEQLQLNVPMRAICKDDCQGLCPQCGVNRNLESCTCETANIDPRWEALRSLQRDN
jgi:uncharacterized protein